MSSAHGVWESAVAALAGAPVGGVYREAGITIRITMGITMGITIGITMGITLGITMGIAMGITMGKTMVIPMGIPMGITMNNNAGREWRSSTQAGIRR